MIIDSLNLKTDQGAGEKRPALFSAKQGGPRYNVTIKKMTGF